MKWLTFTLFLIVFQLSQAYVAKNEDPKVKKGNGRIKREDVLQLPRPSLVSMTTSDPADVEISWTPVESDKLDDPILGYKVLIWEIPNTKTYKYRIINGVKTLVEEDSEPELTLNIPKSEPKTYTTKDTKYHFSNLKFSVYYEFRVRSYSKTRESELSGAMRVRLEPPANKNKDEYHTV